MSNQYGDSALKIEWVDDTEVPSGGPRAELRLFAAQLKAKPGSWAKYPSKLTESSAIRTVSAQRHNKVSTFPTEEFEMRRRGAEIYIRALPVGDE